MATKESKRFYRGCWLILGPFVRLVRPMKVTGRENIVKGAALICANHSAMIDPIQIALALDSKTQIHVLAKAELFKIPVLSWLLKKLGMISVDRSIADVNSIKTSLTYLKNGEKVVIFPEGTRVSEDDAVAAKSGAVKLAERAGVPIMPVFLPRKKPIFIRHKFVFGEPYLIEKSGEKRKPEDYAKLSEELMDKIKALDTGK